MDFLEQEKQRLLKEYRCDTIAQVLEALELRLTALQNAQNTPQQATIPRAAEQPPAQDNAPEATEIATKQEDPSTNTHQELKYPLEYRD